MCLARILNPILTGVKFWQGTWIAERCDERKTGEAKDRSAAFSALFGGVGTVTNVWHFGVSLVLEDPRFSVGGELAADRICFNDGRWSADRRSGDHIRFQAKVVPYLKGRRSLGFLSDSLRHSPR